MISVGEGQARVLARVTRATAPEVVPVARALGRTLARDIPAPFDVPPADNSAVDGYAVTARDLVPAGRARLSVVGELRAGGVFAGRLGPGQSLRIMTGAPMPDGADTVVPQELATADGPVVLLEAVSPGANVRARGEDVRAGDVALRQGTVLRPQELGLLASFGLATIAVFSRPRVALLSTGDEVAEPGGPRAPGQIFDANRFSLHGLVEAAGAVAVDCGIVPDARAALSARLGEAAASAEVVITSGGVSVGAHDLVKEVLSEVGGIEFWQVAMQPGRPFAVGTIGTSLFFGLPGNPVASVLCFLIFVRPALWRLAGRRDVEPPRFVARATETMRKRPGRREFKRGVVSFSEAGWEVRTTGPQGSGILSSLVAANCLIILEETRGDVAPGESVLVEPL
jgi:molybdopterin molybdotransferase